ncbi:AGAP007416PAlike, partial [Caligus rogercresseyi]
SSNDAILNSSTSSNNANNIKNSSDPRKRFPASGSSDEDPYSLTPSGSSGSSGKGNRSREELATRIPPGEKEYYGPQNWAKHHIRQLPDYSDDMGDENTLSKKRNTRLKNARHKSTDSERTGRKPMEQSNL